MGGGFGGKGKREQFGVPNLKCIGRADNLHPSLCTCTPTRTKLRDTVRLEAASTSQ